MQNLSKEELILQIKNLQEELQKLKKQKKYGIVWEEKAENIDKNFLPILEEKQELRIEETENKPYNLIIEGDNFHSLSILQNTHKNKIDVIYIDPPYNTGNKDFIYNDNYVDKEDTYRHSKWLSFMNKRLILAKNLLKEDGVIFISIDDNEFAQLKLLCDKIFGEKNFVGKWNWYKSATPPNLSNKIKKNIEYIFAYEKNKNENKYVGIQKESKSNDPLTKIQNSEKILTFPAGSININFKNNIIFPGIYGTEKYPNELLDDLIIENWKNKNPVSFKNKFIWLQEKLEEEIKNGTQIFLSKDLVFSYKKANYSKEVPPNFINEIYGVGTTEQAGNDLFKIFNEKVFDYPKPVSLIKYLINFLNKPNSTILDFFAGSGTTGHAVLELNKEDGGNRQFILCSNTEATKENSEKNICQNITYERNKRVIQGYTNSKGEKIEGLGGNLRYYKTDFIPKNRSIDDLRYSFINKCDDLLGIKENTFTKMHFGREIPELKIFKNKNHVTVILYDIFYFEETINILKELAENKISLYVFSMSKEMFQEELQDFAKNITFENIPDEIMETYEKIFNF